VSEASEALKLTAEDLYGFGVIEKIIPEDDGLFERLKAALTDFITAKSKLSGDALAEERYARFRKIGADV
jgi:acetyl-CoA carboxylase carboxyl transferase subunit alpha